MSIKQEALTFCLRIGAAAHPMLPEGMIALQRNGKPVWVGKLGAPIEDVECDLVLMAPADFERLIALVEQDPEGGR